MTTNLIFLALAAGLAGCSTTSMTVDDGKVTINASALAGFNSFSGMVTEALSMAGEACKTYGNNEEKGNATALGGGQATPTDKLLVTLKSYYDFWPKHTLIWKGVCKQPPPIRRGASPPRPPDRRKEVRTQGVSVRAARNPM